MPKPDPKLDWQMDDEDAWQAGQSPTSQATPTPRRTKVAIFGLVAALVLIMGGGLWPRSTPAKGTTDKLPPVAAQTAATTTMPAELPLTMTIEALGNPMRVDKLQRSGDRVMAQVTVHYPEDGMLGAYRAYRETHFYQKSGSTWQPIPPDLTLLGPEKRLQIANFTILYRSADADAVYDAVPKLQQLYGALRQDFGLPAVVPTVAYTIEVVSSSGQIVNFYDDDQRKLTIPSPLLLSAPVEITPATLIEQATVYPLANLQIHEAIYQHDARWQYNFSHWYPIENSFSLWELWQEDGPLAAGRVEVVRWLYANSESITPQRRLPDNYEAICHTYHIWQLVPSALSIPLACNAEDQNELPFNQYPALARSWPPESKYPIKWETHMESQYSATSTLETMLEYIVATYGRDKLRQLFAALGQYTTPDTLIPALFGVSRADFEAGWQAYLARHY